MRAERPYTITGITLNHAASIGATPAVTSREATLPAPLLSGLGASAKAEGVPKTIGDWVEREFGIDAGGAAAEWSDEELYLSAPGPGRDAWVSIDRETGAAKFESTDRGWISYFNDLHKGRNAGPAWGWFLDIFAVACLVFCITGLFLLHLHARQRRMTWPLVGLGLLIPLLIALILIH
jgi:hypothetical protein